ncbi:MAG: phenylpropionate dioxygenase-like ring-hydroxylating dioxygenase large terminal subunit [Paracoccaceae bacterium]|jgi:phenylpropionate dioxygenase-like ring-hydroxylating dioxygenase large terminal subunit
MYGDSGIRNPDGGAPRVWPDDETLIPDWIYTDQDIYDRELEKIFLGRHWNYVGLDCEVPEPGNYFRSYVGPLPVVVTRDMDGEVHVFENRCAHRGVEFCREYRGSADSFICPYHNWTYNLQGDLTAVPFRRGVKGQGGMPKDFDMATRGLRKFHVATRGGVIFATACDDMESIEEYLGPVICPEFDATFDGGEMKLLGVHRNILPANWKLYQENLKDPYHATLLHTYLTTFGLFVSSNESNIPTDKYGRHGGLLSRRSEGRPDVSAEDAANMQAFKQTMELNDPRVLDFVREFDSKWSGSVLTIFPTLTALRQTNILNTRLLVPRGPNEFMMIWTVFGRADDDEEMVRHRLRQNNIFGPAGFLGIEDNEALKFLQDGLRKSMPRDGLALLGDDDEPTDTIITERAIRGMYRYYRDVMEL